MHTIFSVVFVVCGIVTVMLLFGVGLAYEGKATSKSASANTTAVVAFILMPMTGIFFYAAGYVAQ
jgi:hypothetical protein